MRDAAQVAATLKSMQDDRTTANVKGLRDDDSASITADTPEAVRSDANTGKGSAATQSIPETSGPGSEQPVLAGPLARLLAKISLDPMEILRALDDLSEMIAERVRREIRAFHRESDAQHEIQATKLDAIDTKLEARTAAQDAKIEARMDTQDAKIDAINKLCDEIDKQTCLVLVLFKIQLAFIGVFVSLGLMHWFSV